MRVRLVRDMCRLYRRAVTVIVLCHYTRLNNGRVGMNEILIWMVINPRIGIMFGVMLPILVASKSLD